MEALGCTEMHPGCIGKRKSAAQRGADKKPLGRVSGYKGEHGTVNLVMRYDKEGRQSPDEASLEMEAVEDGGMYFMDVVLLKARPKGN